MGHRATEGNSLRGLPKPVRFGKSLGTRSQSKIARNLKVRDEVQNRHTGQTGTVVEVFALTVAVRTPDNEIISGLFDDFVVKGSRWADHGALDPVRSPLPQGYGESGAEYAKATYGDIL